MPKGITKEELIHVSEVARLKLTDAELDLFTKQVSDIIDWFNELSSIDTKDVEPSFHPLPTVNVTREDKVLKCFTLEEAMSNTENKEAGFFKAPRIV